MDTPSMISLSGFDAFAITIDFTVHVRPKKTCVQIADTHPTSASFSRTSLSLTSLTPTSRGFTRSINSVPFGTIKFHMEPKQTTSFDPSEIPLGASGLRLTRETTFVSGKPSHPIAVVKVSAPASSSPQLPVVMIHGGFHTGHAYLKTPDGRKGWAHLFAECGYSVLVPDWPAHGLSPGLESIQHLHTLDVAQSMGELVRTIGPCILVAHSAGGPLAWWLAENFPELVAGIVGIAPGPPANILPELPSDPKAIHALRLDPKAGYPVYSAQDLPVQVDTQFIKEFWANSIRFPQKYLNEYARTIVPESPKILNERFNIGGAGLKLKAPNLVGQRPVLIVTGDQDHRHPQHVDGALANYLGADFFWLPDLNMHGNGHMLMIEDNSHAIALLLMQWLQKRGL